MTELFIALAKRSPLILALLAAAGWCLLKSSSAENSPSSFSFALLAFLPGIAAAILIARPVAAFFGDLLGQLYMPSTKIIPPPLWLLVEHLIKNGRFEDALVEYNKIIHYHPQELRAHLGRLELLIRSFQDLETAEKAYKKSRRKLKDPAARTALTDSYTAWLGQIKM